MQLASNNDREEEEECSESQPILNPQPSSDPESSFSCEIIPTRLDFAAANNDGDLQNVRVDETCHLVNADQPQCRICLDIGGP